MFKGKYKRMIDQVHPSDELLCDVLKSVHSSDKKEYYNFILSQVSDSRHSNLYLYVSG